jgi:signal transduction histidine kinase
MPEIPAQPRAPSPDRIFSPSAWEKPSGFPSEPVWFARQLPQCVFLCDGQGRCVLANGPLLSWLGRAEADVVGRTIFELWPDETETGEHEHSPGPAMREAGDLQLVLEGGRIEQVETRTGVQGPRAVRAVKFPWIGTSGRIEGMVVVFDELASTPPGEEGSLTNPETLFGMVRGILHDFNNGLMMLYGQLGMLEEKLPVSLRATGALEGLRASLDYVRRLPRKLDACIRGEPMAREQIDLNTMISSLDVMLRPRLGLRTSLELRLGIGGAWVEGDSTELLEVLMNLTGNALDAMPDGGRLTIETRTLTLASTEGEPAFTLEQAAVPRGPSRQAGSFIRVTIRDSGTGITPEVMPHIFEPRFTTRPPGKGSGLGLAIVKEIVGRHGGWITCQSKPGEGTSFVLHLPALAEEDSPAPQRRPGVLVIEPDELIRNLAKVNLGQGPFYVEAVRSLSEARQRLAGGDGRFDLVVVSSEQCGAGGAGVSALLGQLPGAGLVVTTTGLMPLLPAECNRAIRGIVQKPYSGEHLLRVVGSILGGSTPGSYTEA